MRKNFSSCDCTEIRTHVPTSEDFEVANTPILLKGKSIELEIAIPLLLCQDHSHFITLSSAPFMLKLKIETGTMC